MRPQDEGASVFWSNEIQAALGIARPVLDAGDKVGARMAFKQAYERIVRAARADNRRPEWSLSIGWDKHGRADAVRQAVSRGLLSAEQAAGYLPHSPSPIAALLEGKGTTPLLTGATDDEQKTVERGIAMVRQTLATLDQRAAERKAEDDRIEQERRARFERNRAEQLARANEAMRQRGENA